MSILNERQVSDLYDKNARYYDLLLLPFRALGVHRRRAGLVDDLCLKEGDTVVDLCCGTGANISLLANAVGKGGRIVGVDLSAQMIGRARRKTERLGMKNVELICASVDDFELPIKATVVISTFGLEMVPTYASVIARMADELKPGSRFGLLGLKHPDGWPDWLIELGIKLNHPFGVSREYEDFRPWQAAQEHLSVIYVEEHLFGAAYSCVAEKI